MVSLNEKEVKEVQTVILDMVKSFTVSPRQIRMVADFVEQYDEEYIHSAGHVQEDLRAFADELDLVQRALLTLENLKVG